MNGKEAVVAAYASYFTRPAAAVADELVSYCELLRRWQRVQNLVSRETLDAVWTRHIADSLQVLKLLRAQDRLLLDLGSGGGMPAIPLAIARKGLAGARHILVEPNARKVAFLRTAIRELGLAAEVLGHRADEIDSRETSKPDVITSRALAPLDTLCGLAGPLFGPETRAIFHKGREYGEELVESAAHWDYDVVVVQSETSADGVLLELRHLRAKTAY